MSGTGYWMLPPLRLWLHLRWGVLTLWALALLAAPRWVSPAAPWWVLWSVLGFGLLINLQACRRPVDAAEAQAGADAAAGELAFQLLLDLGMVGVLTFLGGGAANPMISFLLVPVIFGALTLSGRAVWRLAAVAVAIYAVLMFAYLPLEVFDPAHASELHLAGMWLTFFLSVLVLVGPVVQLRRALVQREQQVAELHEQALRDEHVLALGAVAAGAAHELGTPLATATVLVGELLHLPSLDEDTRADLQLVRQQLQVCKDTVSQLAAHAGHERVESVAAVPAGDWLRETVGAWGATRQATAFVRLQVSPAAEVARLAVDTRLAQVLGSLFDNARRVSPEGLALQADVAAGQLLLRCVDQGPGFPEEVLRVAGRQPVRSLHGSTGLGLMLALSAVERRGGRLRLFNTPEGGVAELELPLVEHKA